MKKKKEKNEAVDTLLTFTFYQKYFYDKWT